MLDRAKSVIASIRNKTDRVILFHSASGKDSIALLDLLYASFTEVVCVYMYIVKDLEHINRYINYAKLRYPNVRFIQIPHYGVYSYIKGGLFGCKQNPKQRQYTLAALTEIVRERTGIDWVCFGFKKVDSINRRVMLSTYEQEAICEKTHKFFPLSTYKNSDVLRYIAEQNLMQPERYGKRGQSAGTAINDVDYLLFLRETFPQDLTKVYAEYPATERILYEYDYEQQHKAEQNTGDLPLTGKS